MRRRRSGGASRGRAGSDLRTIDLGASLDPAPSSLEVTRALAVAPDGTIWIGGALSAARGILFAVEPDSRAVRSREMPSPLDAGIVATDDGAFAGGIDGRLKVAPDMTRGGREEPLLSEGHPLECTLVALDDGNIVTCDGTGRVLALASDDVRVLNHLGARLRVEGAQGAAPPPIGESRVLRNSKVSLYHCR